MNSELQQEYTKVREALSALRAEQREITKALNSVSRSPSPHQTARAKQLPGEIFEQQHRFLELQIAQLTAEAPPLLQRVRAAQAVVARAQADYDQAQKVLREAQDALAKADVPLMTNGAQRGKLQEALLQLELERGLDLQAERTGKPVQVVIGAHGRPGLNQPALDTRPR